MKQRSRFWKIGQSVTRYSSQLGYGISLLLALWLAVATMVHLDYKQAVDEIEHNNEQLVRAFEAHVRSSFMVVDQQLLLIRAEYERAGITPAIRTILDQTRQSPILAQVLLLGDILRQGFVRDSLRDQILAQARQEYGTEPCFPWAEYPGHCTLKAPNGKWYGLVMQVPYAVLGIGKAGRADVLNVKNLPEKIQALVDGEHFLPAYHMNKKYWLSVLLDSPAVLPLAQELLRESYALAAGPGRRSGRKR